MQPPAVAKEDTELALNITQDNNSSVGNQPKPLTKWAKLILALLILKMLATIISLFWGLGNAIYYFKNVRGEYYPVVFYNSGEDIGSSSSTTHDSIKYVLLTNNISNYTADYNTVGSVTKLMYNKSTMEYCRIYRFDQRAVFLTLNNDSLFEIENYQFTSTPKKYTDTTFFRFQFVVEVILVVLSGCLYLLTLARDVIGFRKKHRKYRGIISPAKIRNIRGQDNEQRPKTCFSYAKRAYSAVKEVLLLLIIDVGFVNIYNTKLNTCLTNKPPSKDLIAGLIGQSNLDTSGIMDYNLTVGTSQLWMNMIAFCALSYLVYKFITMGISAVIRYCKKETESEKRCRRRIDLITEVLEMGLLLFLSIMLIIWRLFYVDWSRFGDVFSVTGKEIFKILASIFSCCKL